MTLFSNRLSPSDQPTYLWLIHTKTGATGQHKSQEPLIIVMFSQFRAFQEGTKKDRARRHGQSTGRKYVRQSGNNRTRDMKLLWHPKVNLVCSWQNN